MFTKQELENKGATELAVLCGQVAESPTAGSVEADQGRDLKNDWAKLMISMTPPPIGLKEKRAIESEVEKWKRKAVSFLAAVLPAH